jgi:hypothetical protein
MLRPFFSFSYGINKVAISISIEQVVKHDLVGWGYDIAPTLISLKISLLFIHFEAGNLFLNHSQPID